MRKFILVMVVTIILISSLAFGFYLHIGQDRSEIIGAIGQPNYSEVQVDQFNGKIERCQWGSERVGAMLVIWFKDGKVLSFESKGKLN
jgi:hypothetical protein